MKRSIVAAVALAAAALPASASAATIAVTGGEIAFTAQRGERNALELLGTVDGPRDFRMEFLEYAVPLTAGPGCLAGIPVVCGDPSFALPVAIDLGDRDDVASTNDFVSRLSLDAGSGSDDVLAGGVDVAATGGTGDDTLVLAASNSATGDGGAGRDRIAAGLGAAATVLEGGSGADLLVPGGVLANDASGGSGDDQLVILASTRGATLNGGAGNDVLLGLGTLNGGSGSDLLVSHAGGATVDAGSGVDVVDVQGGGTDTVACGSGIDVAWVDDADTVATDCELVRRSPAPAFHRAVVAEAAARTLAAHRPDPSGR